jgi:hypothetical protein
VAGLDFFVDVVASGAVLGVGLTDPPEMVLRVLGDGYVEDERPTTLRRDFGLVEFFWNRRSRSQPWYPSGFAVQVYRLGVVDVDPGLVDRYGPFGIRLRYRDLDDELHRLGYRLQEITQDADGPGYRRFWLAESRVCVTVAATGWQRLDAGDVWSISGPYPPQAVAAAEVGASRQAVKDGLTHLLRLGDIERAGWLDRRQPAPVGRANWWLFLLLVIDQQIRDHPDRAAEWAALKVWLLRRAEATDVFAAADSAEMMAYFLLAVRREHPDLLDRLPSADDVIRACLQAIPFAVEEVPLLDDDRDLHRLDLTQMRRSRQAKNLVNAAQWHREYVRDEHLADQLRRWIAVRPRLV